MKNKDMNQSIPLPPPEHPADCCCARCFEARTFSKEYSKRALPHLAKALLSQFSPMVTLWFLWLVNKSLPKPLTEDEVYYMCKEPQSWIDGTQLSIWERESFRYTPPLQLDNIFSQASPPRRRKLPARSNPSPFRRPQAIPGVVKKRHAQIEVTL